MALSDIAEPFIWGAGGARKTPEQIARDREVAAALMQQGLDFSPIASPWQGAARVANAAAGAFKDWRSAQASTANAGVNQSLIQNLLGGGSQQFPAAPSLASGGMASGEVPSIPQTAEASAIRQGLVDRGLPEHVADAFVLNFQDESGLNPGINEKNPVVPGSRGGFGLYQLTGPRRTAYEKFASSRGVDPSDVDAQLDFLMTELQGPEAKAAQSILSAPDTGTAAAAIVNDFLRPSPEYRNSRASRYLSLAGQTPASPAATAVDVLAQGKPAQVASLDSSIASDLVQRPGLTGAVQPIPNSPASLAGISPSDAATPLAQAAPAIAAPRNITDMPVASPQVAQALAGPDLSKLSVLAGGNAGTYQPGHGSNMQAIVQALSSPYADEQTKKIAGMLLGQQMEQQQQASDPMRALEMQIAQEKLNQMRNPQPQIPDSVQALNIRAQQAGLQPGTKEYQDFMISGGRGPLVNVNTGNNTSKFVEESDKAAATRMNDIVTAGQTAPQTMADMQQLIDLGVKIGTGQGAQIKGLLGPYAQTLGININGLDDVQAYNAITSRLAPQMRAVGSGSSSDKDVALFFKSLPSLGNTQGGNEIIANTMKAVAQNKINAADIASRAQRGEISWQDADKQIRELPNPYDLFKQFQKETQDETRNGQPMQGQVVDGYRFKGGDPADPNSWEPVQ